MNEQQQPAAQAATPEVSLADISLADYRASRAVETPPEAPKEPAPAPANAGDESLGEDEGGADDTTEQSGDAAGEEKPKKKGGFQRKLEQKDREIDDLRRQLADKSAGKPEGQKPSETPAPAAQLPEFAKPKPKLEDFDSVEEHTDALTDWKLEKRDHDKAARVAAERAQTEARTLIEAWTKRETAAKESHADYDDVLKLVAEIKLSPAHQVLFLESEAGAEIAYQLATNPDELKKFAALSPTAAARMFGRLEVSHEGTVAAPQQSETRVSNAPKPPRTLSGRTAGVAAKLDPSKLSNAEYRKARESGRI